MVQQTRSNADELLTGEQEQAQQRAGQMSAEGRPNRLTRAEEKRLFTLIWQNKPEAKEAREAIIADNLIAVRNVILKHPACWYFDREDATQEAYTILADLIDRNRVDRSADRPGAYLYRCACLEVYERFCSYSLTQSFDQELPGTEGLTLHDVTAAPVRVTSDALTHSPRIQALYAALRRLPIHQQCELEAFFQMEAFDPGVDEQQVLQHYSRAKTAVEARRYKAYVRLRHDHQLITALAFKRA